MPETALLQPNALAGLRIAISVSESADLERLGLVEIHFRLALAEIARCVLVSGGKLAYGGHLGNEGYTNFLVRELHRYSRRDRPLRICLAWQEHRKLSAEAFEQKQRELGLFAEIVCLDPDGSEVDWHQNRGALPEPERDISLQGKALTALRRYMTRISQCRVLLGGRRDGFVGVYPGVVEEALIALQQSRPLYLAGGFGGATSDICRALNVDDGTWFPPQGDTGERDSRLVDGLNQISRFTVEPDWQGLRNGLTVEENRQLAATHRPTEIAALVSVGLGRLAQSK